MGKWTLQGEVRAPPVPGFPHLVRWLCICGIGALAQLGSGHRLRLTRIGSQTQIDSDWITDSEFAPISRISIGHGSALLVH
jgi:hypothetical protein